MNSKKNSVVLIPWQEDEWWSSEITRRIRLNAHLNPLAVECSSLQPRRGCENKTTSALWESGNSVCLARNMIN